MLATLWSVDEKRLTAALEAVVESLHPVRIIAFGSRTRNEARPDSDLDLAILFDGIPSLSVSGRAWNTFAEFEVPVDLLNVSIAKHKERSEWFNSIHQEISQKGLVLYDAEDTAVRRDAVAIVARG